MDDYTDLAVLARLSELDAELAELLKHYTPPPPPSADIDYAAIRLMNLEEDSKRMNASIPPGVTMFTKNIPMRDGFQSEIRIFQPANHFKENGGSGPLYMLYYGGGFAFGNTCQFATYANTLVHLFGATIVLPSYRLAPENPFPVGVHDSWDTFAWVAKNAASLGADLSAGFIVGGASAGANMASVVVQKAVSEAFSPLPTGLWMCIPAVLTPEIVPEHERHLFISMETNANSPGLNSAMIGGLMKMYKPDTQSPLFSPFNAKNPHKGMPRTYFQVAGFDPLRDDGLIYERIMRQSGVTTSMDVYPGVPHGHFVMFPELRSSKKAIRDSITGLGWLLGREVDGEMVSQLLGYPSSNGST